MNKRRDPQSTTEHASRDHFIVNDLHRFIRGGSRSVHRHNPLRGAEGKIGSMVTLANFLMNVPNYLAGKISSRLSSLRWIMQRRRRICMPTKFQKSSSFVHKPGVNMHVSL
jgi:hypothetical protein